MKTREIHLVNTPDGMPKDTDFELVETDLPDPGAGEVLVENIFMSVDPYMRGRMRQVAPSGEALQGAAIGKIIASNNDNFKVGEYVNSGLGWREHYVSNGSGLGVVDGSLAPLSTYLGIMGMPGLTAYGGILVTGALKEGETVFVSAASGAVGSVVGQIAKIKNCRVVGSAGSDAKVEHLLSAYGFDPAFNYKSSNILSELRKGAPDGLDIYFENVGGAHLEAALWHMRQWGRIPVCGMIATYNDSKVPTPGPINLSSMIYNHITMRGFVVSEFSSEQPQFLLDMSSWIREGKIKYQETVFEGIEKAPQAFQGLFIGANEGKMLVKLSDP